MAQKPTTLNVRRIALCAVAALLLVGAVVSLLLVHAAQEDIPGSEPVLEEISLTTTAVTTLTTTQTTTSQTTATTEPFVMPTSTQLTVTAILQKPELPTGCEITCLSMLLSHLGYEAEKTMLADNYLAISKVGGVSFDDYFVGSPYDGTAFGCNAPVIAKAAKDFLSDVGADPQRVRILDAATPDTLYEQVARGNPVIVWATQNLCKPTKRLYWNLPDGTPVYFFTGEHCLLLTGFDLAKKTVTFCDPLKGEKSYGMTLFETRFSELGSQAVVIEPTP